MQENLGSCFDEHMAMDIHIGNICNKAFKGLYNIRQIRKFISIEATKILVHAFVTSHLDYCNFQYFSWIGFKNSLCSESHLSSAQI